MVYIAGYIKQSRNDILWSVTFSYFVWSFLLVETKKTPKQYSTEKDNPESMFISRTNLGKSDTILHYVDHQILTVSRDVANPAKFLPK